MNLNNSLKYLIQFKKYEKIKFELYINIKKF